MYTKKIKYKKHIPNVFSAKHSIIDVCKTFIIELLKLLPPPKNRTLKVRCIFWWEYACINRAKNKQEFTDLMQRVKVYKEKWLNTN